MMTKEEALDLLVEMDVAKWGEGERAASRAMHAKMSHGLMVNAVASRWQLSDDPEVEKKGIALSKEIAKAKLLTREDWRLLRQGG